MTAAVESGADSVLRSPRDLTAAVRAGVSRAPGYVVLPSFWRAGHGDPERSLLELAADLGSLVPSRRQGPLVEHVADVDPASARGATTRRALPFHTDLAQDVPDVFMLLVVRAASAGGMTRLVDGRDLYRRVRSMDPDTAARLEEPVPFDTDDGTGRPGSLQYMPVFAPGQEGMRVTYNRARIHRGFRLAGRAMDDACRAALALVDSTLEEPGLAVDRMLESGDLLVADNTRVLHARTSFGATERASSGRLLLRTWVRRHPDDDAGQHDRGEGL